MWVCLASHTNALTLAPIIYINLQMRSICRYVMMKAQQLRCPQGLERADPYAGHATLIWAVDVSLLTIGQLVANANTRGRGMGRGMGVLAHVFRLAVIEGNTAACHCIVCGNV
jgi:hypothetical protein